MYNERERERDITVVHTHQETVLESRFPLHERHQIGLVERSEHRRKRETRDIQNEGSIFVQKKKKRRNQ